jgi:thiamine pyrophosphokinase
LDGQGIQDFGVGAADSSAVSLIALTDVVRGIDAQGLAYPLADASMESGSTLGVSNRPVGGWDGFSVSCREGVLLVVVTPAE